MGGDHGPQTTIQGVVLAAKKHPNVNFVSIWR